ncbi:hypothetical protein WJX75_006330 [Coccomyxa subellipsoidea]|uniref:Uncharacterized protein n=1 Tax=Coccomyxa subellipsoidea TaxID=248742 RepID=A0ABR2YTN3_9CHLO
MPKQAALHRPMPKNRPPYSHTAASPHIPRANDSLKGNKARQSRRHTLQLDQMLRARMFGRSSLRGCGG